MDLGLKLFLSRKLANGKIIPVCEITPKSFVQAWIGILTCQFSQTSVSILRTSGLSGANFTSATNFAANSPAGNLDYGIVVGSGSNAVTIEDYSLQTLITHGTGAGQLSYGAVEFPYKYELSGSSRYTDVRRTMTNDTASPIDVNEVGIYCRGYSSFYYMFERTIVDYTVAPAEALVATYRFIKTVA